MVSVEHASSANSRPGHLWTTGFRNGDLKTPLFDDVLPTLEAWKAAGKTLAIFSSGSVQAQLQFFSYVKDGPITRDVKPLFSAHYDTVNAGPKMEKASYEKICSELGQPPSKVVFLTDNVKGMLACSTCPETPHHPPYPSPSLPDSSVDHHTISPPRGLTTSTHMCIYMPRHAAYNVHQCPTTSVAHMNLQSLLSPARHTTLPHLHCCPMFHATHNHRLWS
jgi:hypothetical protein